MLTTQAVRELHTMWFPHVTDAGLARLIDLLEQGSPLLIHGCFTKAMPMGCLATHAAWHHPRTAHMSQEAGIAWLTHVAGLNPATSKVIREWDERGPKDWQLRTDLLAEFQAERIRREQPVEPPAELQTVERMLERILEPEVMDSPEEANDYDAMDHSTVNRAFVADFLLAWDSRSPVLDVGTGTAQIPLELCRQHLTAEVVAIDLAEQMLVVARENVHRAGFTDRIHLERQNGRDLTFANNHFPGVMSNSIVHHIPEPLQAIAEMVRVCAPGGLLFVRDLCRPLDGPTLDRLVNTYARDANNHQRKMFAASLHAALTVDEVRALVGRFGFAPATVRMTSDRHWTWTAKRF